MIALALQKGTYVYVYDEKNRQITYRYGKLVGFTATSFSIQRDGCIFVYDEKDKCLYYRNV